MDYLDFDRSPAAIAIPTLSIIAIILCLPPFVWHVKNRNLAASSLVLWISLDNFFAFINALIWPTDNITSWWNGPVLCDIEIKVTLAATAGLTGSMACIMRNLAQVMDTNRTVPGSSLSRKKRELAVNVLLCFGCPAYLMAIHYVVQPSRYYIFAISGCSASYDNSWPSIVLVFVWPPILCILAAYYCVLVVIRLHKYRREFADILSSSGSNLTKSRFMRLFLIALIFIIVCLPVQLYVFYRNCAVPHLPYSWDLVHSPEWWHIIKIPTRGMVPFDRWIWLGCGFLVFFFFGLGKDATKMYRRWLFKLGFGKMFPNLKDHGATSTTPPSIKSRFGSFNKMVKLVFCRTRSRRSEIPYFHDRHGSVMTEVVTPSPSDPKKAFDRDSGTSRSYSPLAHLQEYEKTILPYPVGVKEPYELGFKHEQHLSSEAHVLSRAAVTPEGRSFDEPQVAGPRSGNGSRNVRVSNELDQIAEHSGRK